MRRVFAGIAAALVAASLSAPAVADAAAGSAKGVNPAAAADLGGAERTLVVGSDIFIGDLVKTGPRGQVQILFADNTKLVVGPQSALKIDDYLLRNDGSAGKFAVDMLSGTFRFATGSGPKPSYELNTPTGTIGVRGTQFDVFVSPADGSTMILHYLGTVLFRAKGESKWTTLHDLCTLGQITSRAAVLGSAKVTTGDFRTQLKTEFRYAEDQSPLLRPFWFVRAFECLHNPPEAATPPAIGTPNTGTSGPPNVVVTPPPPPPPPTRQIGALNTDDSGPPDTTTPPPSSGECPPSSDCRPPSPPY